MLETTVMDNTKQKLERLDAFRAGRFSEWHGIEEECSFDEIAGEFGVSRAETFQGYLGESINDAWYCSLQEAHIDCSIRSWFDAAQHLILVDMKTEGLGLQARTLLEMFGKPEATLDVWHGLLLYKNGEWVYHSRGISFIVSTSTRKVKHASGFKPMSLADYIENVRLDLRTQRLPMR